MISMLNFTMIRRFPSALAIGLALTFSASCLAAPAPSKQAESVNEAPASAEWKMSVKFVPKDQGWAPLHYERVKEIVFFKAKINGIDASLMHDNGAPTSIGATFAKRAGLSIVHDFLKGKAGTAELSRQLFDHVDIEVPHLLKISGPVQAIDFQALSRAIGHPVDAILGGDALSVLALTLMPNGQMLALAPSGSVHFNGPAATIPLANGDQIDGKPVKLAIDLGSNDTVALSDAAWKRIIAHGTALGESKITNAEGAALTVQNSPGHTLQVGPVKVGGVTIPNKGSLPNADEGLLGVTFLSHFNLVLDIGAKTLVLSPIGTSPTPASKKQT